MPYRHLIPQRQPHEIVFAAFISATSMPAALGLAPLPASVRSETPEIVGRIILILLAFGCLTIVIGNVWPRPSDRRTVSVTALLIERMGLVVASVGAYLYAGIVWSYTGPAALGALGFVLGFAVASTYVAWKITRALQALEKAP
jgi:hypothetical protein